MPENFDILYIHALWLLPLPLLIYALLPAFKTKSSVLKYYNLSFAEDATGRKVSSTALHKNRHWLIWFSLIISWILVVFAISNPVLKSKPDLEVKDSRNFLIVPDISFSMANTDWKINGKPMRRWDAVKSVMHDFFEKRQGDRMGLVFFGSSAYVQAPFSSDLHTVERLLNEADVGMAGQMTNIGKAIMKGKQMFENDTIKTKVMLVLTDGVDSGEDISPLDAAEMAKNDSIKIYTIGIGIPGESGSDLDENTLKQIAEISGAKYFRASDTEELKEIYSELDKLEPMEYEEVKYVPDTKLYYIPLSAVLILILINWVILSFISLIKKSKTIE